VIDFVTGGYAESALFLLVVFFVLLRLRGVPAGEAFQLPVGGLVWSALLGAALFFPISSPRCLPSCPRRREILFLAAGSARC